jgi:glutamate synthase domain-containing protein 2/glutamate synthase domain-containing protein 1/glutamate synthase domain-containing protein 3
MIREENGLYDQSMEHDACGVGFVADIDGTPSHSIVEEGIQVLCNLEHRGAVGADGKTGDGAGMLVQIPHRFYEKVTRFDLPEEGSYGTGLIFLPTDESRRRRAEKLTDASLRAAGATLLGWRDVPVNPDCLGEMARDIMPAIRQIFVGFGGLRGEELERKLYVLRRMIENDVRREGFDIDAFYIASLSCRTIVYKGMFVAPQFATFYPDVADPDFSSALALVHQRYSTNTFPSWPLAQPFRRIAHNGEINTIRRNINNMVARESNIESPLFGEEIDKLLPIIERDLSDSAVFDNVFELLSLGGRSIEHSMIMMVPEAFGTRYHISQDKRAFFEYHAAVMEPWDGPAAISFTDGTKIGAILDRNGLRPSRYVITRSGKIVVASEVGVLDFDPEDVREKGRLAPGKMILVDTSSGRVIKDNEVKSRISRSKPYRRWLEENRIELKGLFQVPGPVGVDRHTLNRRHRAFGYTREDIKEIILPMTEAAQEPLGSMGNDSTLAVLNERPVLLYDYFRQLFAQVTNPPIDPYRESLVMSLMSFVGTERNLLDETPEHCRQLKLSHPVLTNDDISRLRSSGIKGFAVSSVPMLVKVGAGEGLEAALKRLGNLAEEKIDSGYSLIILSDRDSDADHAAVPALLAMGAVHHHLVRAGKRHRAGIIVETGEVREVHHFATLVGYGASGINPYLVFETLADLDERGYLPEELNLQTAIERYITAVKKGLLKVMSKMGVSTLRSYRGSQIYEAVGLDSDVITRFFTGTGSQVEGIGLDVIERETFERHRAAYGETAGAGRGDAAAVVGKDPAAGDEADLLPAGGRYRYRKNEERHLFTPEAITLLQKAVRSEDYALYKKYSEEMWAHGRKQCTLRGLFSFKPGIPVGLEEVEPADEIMKRFASSAMSFGSISKETHETMAVAMNRIGAMSNSGEGGEDEARFKPREDGENANSRVKQVASARFGVTSAYLASAGELQIKMAQGAKPGEGGQLPGHKVDEIIARVRNSTPGVGLISPPPHHDIYSIEDLAQLIYDLKNANPAARVSVKLVSEGGVGTIAAGVAKGKADMVLISGCDGGTGSSPLSSIKYAGSWWEIGLAETQQVLVRNKLRGRIRVQVDGQLRTGRDIVIAAMLGAEEFGFGTVALVTLGCVMMRKCHLNTCPVGVATQDPELRKRFRGKPEHLISFMRFIAEETREIMAELGMRRIDELVGRTDLLEVEEAVDHYKAKGLDLSRILVRPEVPEGGALRAVGKPELDMSCYIDGELIDKSKDALESGGKNKAAISREIRNCNRTVGATLSYEVSKRYGSAGLPEDTITVDFSGSAGQSFGAFLAKGITFRLEGDSNDYLGKGLSGGRIILYPPKRSRFTARRNIVTGNVNLFGATGGEVFINGMAGERFAVRNSGATAVVEGVGDHGCEYMTGGRVIILGGTGVNFAAGMSGGIAYVLDENQLFDTRCNLEMVDVEPVVDAEDIDFMKGYIARHVEYTGSRFGAEVLENWEEFLPAFVKVMPLDYRLALERIKEREWQESELVEVTEEVYS